jgi:hypothetical protein
MIKKKKEEEYLEGCAVCQALKENLPAKKRKKVIHKPKHKDIVAENLLGDEEEIEE